MPEVSEVGFVTRIRLASPSTRNLLDEKLTLSLLHTLRSAEGRVVLLEAAGPIFCAGDAGPNPHLPELLACGSWLPQPLVVSVQGPAAGAGVALIANAHIAIAAQGVSFALTEIRESRWPEAGWPALTRALGPHRARSLALTGRVFSAPEALQWGLLHELAPAFELDDRAFSTAQHLSTLSPEALTSILRA